MYQVPPPILGLIGDEALIGGAAIPTAKIDELAATIQGRAQALELLTVTDTTLTSAYALTGNTPFIASWAGLKTALRDRIEMLRNYVNRTRSALPADPLDFQSKRKVALAVLQANAALKDTDAAVNDKSLQFWPNYVEAIRKIFTTIAQGAAELAKAASPVLWPLGIAAVVLVAGALYFKS
jgi:hypothetical protein